QRDSGERRDVPDGTWMQPTRRAARWLGATRRGRVTRFQVGGAAEVQRVPLTWSEPTWSEPTWSEPTWSEPTWSEPTWSEPTWSEPIYRQSRWRRAVRHRALTPAILRARDALRLQVAHVLDLGPLALAPRSARGRPAFKSR